MKQPTCVLHPDRRATYTVQGITVCTEDYDRYHDEYQRSLRSNDLSLRSRPFLKQLIRASSEANFPEIVVDK